MIVCEIPSGRLGNAIFRYMAASIFLMNYKNAERVKFIDNLHNMTPKSIIINDGDFQSLINTTKSLPTFDKGTICVFHGYFQFDLYKKYRKQILKYMKRHKNDELYCTDYKNGERFFVKELLAPPSAAANYDVVIHVRLEDFIFNKHVIHPKVLEKIIKTLSKEYKNMCIISNKPTKLIEYEYLSYFTEKYGIKFETNDIITDFHIMSNAKILVCSHSTISWCAALLSDKIEKVFIPDKVMHSHQSFSAPTDNTVLYPNRVCGEDELRAFFSRKK